MVVLVRTQIVPHAVTGSLEGWLNRNVMARCTQVGGNVTKWARRSGGQELRGWERHLARMDEPGHQGRFIESPLSAWNVSEYRGSTPFDFFMQ